MVKENDRKINQERFLEKLCSVIKVFDRQKIFKFPNSMCFYKASNNTKAIDINFIRGVLKLQADFSISVHGDLNMLLLQDVKTIKRSSNDMLLEELRIEAGNV